MNLTVPDECVNVAPAPEATSQLPPTTNDVASAAAGADNVPLVTVTLPVMATSQAESLKSSRVPLTVTLPATERSSVSRSSVPEVPSPMMRFPSRARFSFIFGRVHRKKICSKPGSILNIRASRFMKYRIIPPALNMTNQKIKCVPVFSNWWHPTLLCRSKPT